ncbi:hypothetical protein ACFLUV_02365 [Elusimicrobiota bacterium]
MEKNLLKETEISENMTVGCALHKDEIEFVISTYEVSSSYIFNYSEWEAFVKCINIANRSYKVETSK